MECAWCGVELVNLKCPLCGPCHQRWQRRPQSDGSVLLNRPPKKEVNVVIPISDPPYLIPEMRPQDADWPVFMQLLGYAMSSGISSLAPSLQGMRCAGLRVTEVQEESRYRLEPTLPAIGYKTKDEWEKDCDKYLRPYGKMIVCWLGMIWVHENPLPILATAPLAAMLEEVAR